MRAEEEAHAVGNVETISEEEFKKICDGIHRDRFEIYEFNPSASRSEGLLWMLAGCLISRLSITDEELQLLAASSGDDTYADVVRRILRTREADFDPRPYLDELSKE